MTNTLYLGDNLHVLREHIADESVDLIHLDHELGNQLICTCRNAWRDKVEKDQKSAFVHEVLDRSMITAELWDRYITSHVLLTHDAELKEEAERIADALGAFYQLVGQRMPDDR